MYHEKTLRKENGCKHAWFTNGSLLLREKYNDGPNQ